MSCPGPPPPPPLDPLKPDGAFTSPARIQSHVAEKPSPPFRTQLLDAIRHLRSDQDSSKLLVAFGLGVQAQHEHGQLQDGPK